jgi:hypothetical protein
VETVTGGISGWSLKTRRADGWDPRVSEREGGERYPFGIFLDGPRVDSGAGPDRFPRGPIRIFLFFLLFYFLISDLFPNLLQNVSIQIKQIPSAFKYSLQCFEPLINMFSK